MSSRQETALVCSECNKPLGSNLSCGKCLKWNEVYDPNLGDEEELEEEESDDEDDEDW